MGAPRLPPLKVPTDPAVLGYLAGLVDGEGSIGITSAFQRGKSRSRSHTLRVSITNTSETLIAWLSDTIGGGLRLKRDSRKANWKPGYDWMLYAAQAEQVLLAVLPYLVIKRDQARIALEFRAVGRGGWVGRALDPVVVEKREALKQKIHLLNARGIAN